MDDTDESRLKEAEMVCLMREKLVLRTREIYDFSFMEDVKPKYVAGAVRELVNLEKELRETGVRCVNKIVTWTLGQLNDAPTSAPSTSTSTSTSTSVALSGPKPFFLFGEEYLVKMYTDLDFLSNIDPSYVRYGKYSKLDPFFVSRELGLDSSTRR